MSSVNPHAQPFKLSFYGDQEECAKYFRVSHYTPSNWAAKGYINTYRDQNGRIVYDFREIEAGFIEHGPTKMRDGRKRHGRRIIPVIIPEVVTDGGED